MEKKLAIKLVNIMSSLGGVPKKGYNKSQNYYYMREVDVLEALKKELVENKIILLTSSELEDIQTKERVDKNDNKAIDFLTTVKTTHTFIDCETEEQLVITSIGSGIDSGDKSAAKAITSATKYTLMKTFMISDEGADIENDGITAQPPVIQPVKNLIKPPTIKSEEPKKDLLKDSDNLQDVQIKAKEEPKIEVKESKPVKKNLFTARTVKTEPNFP